MQSLACKMSYVFAFFSLWWGESCKTFNNFGEIAVLFDLEIRGDLEVFWRTFLILGHQKINFLSLYYHPTALASFYLLTPYSWCLSYLHSPTKKNKNTCWADNCLTCVVDQLFSYISFLFPKLRSWRPFLLLQKHSDTASCAKYLKK